MVYEVTALAEHQVNMLQQFFKKTFFFFSILKVETFILLNWEDKGGETGMLSQAMKTVICAGKPVPYIIHKLFTLYLISQSKVQVKIVFNCNRWVALHACI